MTVRRARRWYRCLVAACAAGLPAIAHAQDRPDLSFNIYGMPGLVDMPTAQPLPDAQLAFTIGAFEKNRRTTLAFQVLPRLTGAFRYSAIQNFSGPTNNVTLYDRSFDLQYQLLRETRFRPGVAIGLRDFIGTERLGAEYLVATKEIADGLTLTGGFGWGRLGSYRPFAEVGTRPTGLQGQGGEPTFDRWFRGDVAAFGGLSWAPNDRFTFKLEYSSDDYVQESARGIIDRQSPWNFGLDYHFDSGTQLSLYSLYGTTFGAQVTVQLNPRTFGIGGGVESAPLPVLPRTAGSATDLGWAADATRSSEAASALRTLAANEGLVIEGVRLEPRRAVVRMSNQRYGAAAQAIGRTARAMTRTLPASIETFEIIPVVDGVPMSAVILQRSDLERLEHDAAVEMLARTRIVDAFGRTPPPDPGAFPRFEWSIAPAVQLSAFDPDEPLRTDIGVRASASVLLTPGLELEGSFRQRLGGNLDETTRIEGSGLPLVRTNSRFYIREGDSAIEYLTLAHYGRPAENLYSRLTLGYLETMYAGASAELLWKPVGSRLALGAEVNYVQRRAYDQGFGLQSNTFFTEYPTDRSDPSFPEVRDFLPNEERTIPDWNGHISAYYDLGNDFHARLDVGRYLAGDVGATIAVDREFANGWKVGAFATFTDASPEDFGEGSFDKGLRFTIPLASFIGTPSREENSITLRSLNRDGGARVEVRGRLYERVREYHEPDAAKSWGRFWR